MKVKDYSLTNEEELKERLRLLKQIKEEESKERLRLLKQIKEEESQTFFSFNEIESTALNWDLNMYYSIDELEIKEKSIFLRGWSFIKDVDCDNQKVFVALTHKITKERHFFPLISTMREDVVAQQQSNIYLRSGFMGDISLNVNDYYHDKDDFEIFIRRNDELVSNNALSNYERLIETDTKKLIRKILRK